MKLAVFCGSNLGRSDIYREAAASLGQALAARDIELVFGGSSKGLMKIVADAVLEAGGKVRGIIPRALADKGQLHSKLTYAEIVDTRSVRKRRMAEVADGFIALPGGVGTLEELLEMWVDAQLDGHEKPLGLLDVGGFYGSLLAQIDTMIAEGFLPSAHREMIIAESDPGALLERFGAFAPVKASKWM
jgi:uncharacterized protein (TIGR00730 family)